MIILNQGKESRVVLTLAEKSILTSPIYLFVLKNEQTQVEYSFIAPDYSLFTYRYNEFYIIEKATPDTLNGEIELQDAGTYHYTIYEQESTTNLNKSLAFGIVETGILKVVVDRVDKVAYNPTITKKQYRG